MTSYTSGVGVAQLAEHWIVAPVVVGSNPIAHPPLSVELQENPKLSVNAHLGLFGLPCAVLGRFGRILGTLWGQWKHPQEEEIQCLSPSSGTSQGQFRQHL